MYLVDSIDMESPQTKVGARAPTNNSGDVETLIHIIEVTGQKKTLIKNFYSNGNSETQGDIIESTGDFKTLNCIIELIKIREDRKLLNSEQTFSQDELDASLIFSCLKGYTFIIQVLIYLGADLQTRDKNGNTPLLICAENGFTSIGKLLILRQADVNAANSCGNTALILAAGRSGSVEIVKILLVQPGINVNHQNREGNTALMKATEVMDLKVFRLLLDSHKKSAEAECEPILAAVRACDVDSFSVLINSQLYDSSTMCFVINNIFKDIIEKHKNSDKKFCASEQIITHRLVEYWTNMTDHLSSIFTVARLNSYKVLKLLVESVSHSYSSVHSKKQVNLLMIAVEYGRTDLIQLLLKFGLAPDLRFSHIKCAVKNRHAKCVMFLAKNAEFAFNSACDFDMDFKDLIFLILYLQTEVKQFAHIKDMDELLISASTYGKIKMIDLLLDVGANVNCVDEHGRTPLMRSESADVIHFLVDRGAVVNKYSGTEQCFSPALIYNLNRNNGPETNKQVIEALLKCGANVNGRNSAGSTPLMLAVSRKGGRRTVQLLLDYGADYNATNSKGDTILSLAVSANRTDNILCLLQFSKYSKDILNFKTSHQPAAVIVAARKGNFEVVKHLVDHGANPSITDKSGYTMFSFHSGITYADSKALSCITYLLDQGAYVSPEVLHSLILRGSTELIPKLIQCGLSPLDMSNLTHNEVICPGFVSVSPLSLALMINNASLAHYFIANLFLTKYDTCRLASDQVLREYLQKRARDCLCVLDELSTQPMSLFTIAFVTVQTAVGTTQERQERISKLPLPQLIKDRLLFKQETVNLVIK